MTEKCSLATVLHFTVLQITTFVCTVPIDNFRTINTDHFVRIIAIDNVCLHYSPFTFYECPIRNDIFCMHNFWTIEVDNLWMANNKIFLWTILNDILCALL